MMRHPVFHKLSSFLWSLFCVGFLFGIAFTALPASRLLGSAQSSPPGTARLDSVLVAGSMRFTSEQIAAAIGLRVGATVGREELQGGADKLAALGLFTNIQYKFATVLGGVKVTYQVADVPALPVTYDNFPWFSDEELSAGVKSSGILFDGGAPGKGSILDAISDALEKLLDAHNVHARVSHEVVAQPFNNQTVQQFRVENTDLTIQKIDFSDPLAQNDRLVQESLPDLIGKPYSRSRVELFEFEQVRPAYLTRAYLNVQFGPPAAHFAANPTNPLSGQLIVAAPINVGVSYVWAGVEWKGNDSMPVQDLNKFSALLPGDPADGNKIQSIWETARAAYAQMGFLDAALNPAPQFDDQTKRVKYVVAVKEGPQYHMGKLVLTGLSIEGERRLKKAWNIAPGAVFDKSVYDDFVNTGIKAAFVGLPVHYDKMGKFLQLDPQNAKVDVLLDFQ
jgi:outer membrane protein assembly factor BamA